MTNNELARVSRPISVDRLSHLSAVSSLNPPIRPFKISVTSKGLSKGMHTILGHQYLVNGLEQLSRGLISSVYTLAPSALHVTFFLFYKDQ